MRLINVHSFAFKEFFGKNIPKYAILSHTWIDGEEVTLQDWGHLGPASRKAGFYKIQGACHKARAHGLDWLWVDTNCIDKSSSAELTEAINSMFMWYANADICYAYLNDVPSATDNAPDDEFWPRFRSSRWFTRGWTLQELLAPKAMEFFASDWTKIGSKERSLVSQISQATGVDASILNNELPIYTASISTRMSWASKRTTTREEDIAYCMLGIFGVNMPLLYGEGIRAFTRLQEEIIKNSIDHTIFCWSWLPSVPQDWVSLLAPSPDTFVNTAGYAPNSEGHSSVDEVSVYSLVNAGLSMTAPILYSQRYFFVCLNVFYTRDSSTHVGTGGMACIGLQGQWRRKVLYTRRIPFPSAPVIINRDSCGHVASQSIIVMRHLESNHDAEWRWEPASMDIESECGLLVICNDEKLVRSMISHSENPIDYNQRTGVLWIRELSRSTDKGMITMSGLMKIHLPHRAEESRQRTRAAAFLFVGLKERRGDRRWFCQILRDDEASANEWDKTRDSDMIAEREQLVSQMAATSREQRGYFDIPSGVSLVVGHKITTADPSQTISVLHITRGPNPVWYPTVFVRTPSVSTKYTSADRGSQRTRTEASDDDHDGKYWTLVDSSARAGLFYLTKKPPKQFSHRQKHRR